MGLHDALITAWELNGRGGGRELSADDIETLTESGSIRWVHMDRSHDDFARWLDTIESVPQYIRDALIAEDTRPRFEVTREGALLNLRGVNHNPGDDPDDMVSVRIWISDNLVISSRKRSLMAVQDIREQLNRGNGPEGVGELIAELAERLTERMEPYLESLDEELYDLEERSADQRSAMHRVAVLRSQIVNVRRFLTPQLAALNKLTTSGVPWLAQHTAMGLRNTVDMVTRYIEDLESMRDRAAIVKDTLSQHLAEKMNHNMYLLSVVAGIFLPLGFLTGLLGINVGGMPGVDSSWAFWIVCGLMVIITFIEWRIFRKLGML